LNLRADCAPQWHALTSFLEDSPELIANRSGELNDATAANIGGKLSTRSLLDASDAFWKALSNPVPQHPCGTGRAV
jgi:hypothetical protein